jgi:hypothetical protein
MECDRFGWFQHHLIFMRSRRDNEIKKKPAQQKSNPFLRGRAQKTRHYNWPVRINDNLLLLFADSADEETSAEMDSLPGIFAADFCFFQLKAKDK